MTWSCLRATPECEHYGKIRGGWWNAPFQRYVCEFFARRNAPVRRRNTLSYPFRVAGWEWWNNSLRSGNADRIPLQQQQLPQQAAKKKNVAMCISFIFGNQQTLGWTRGMILHATRCIIGGVDYICCLWSLRGCDSSATTPNVVAACTKRGTRTAYFYACIIPL